jgi:hypothetical protein
MVSNSRAATRSKLDLLLGPIFVKKKKDKGKDERRDKGKDEGKTREKTRGRQGKGREKGRERGSSSDLGLRKDSDPFL